MDAQSLRRAADLERLRALATVSQGKVSLFDDGERSGHYVIDLRYFTAGSPDYPRVRQPASRLVIETGARYPFQPPIATITTPIHHPNVFASGLVCLGAKWLPSEGIDLFVERIARLVTFDPLLVNPQSAANGAALHWYLRAVREFPGAFPSDRVLFTTTAAPRRPIGWNEAGDEAARIIVPCPACGTKLRLPGGRRGRVRCPGCSQDFEAAT